MSRRVRHQRPAWAAPVTRVRFWGVLGALGMRAAFILVGGALLAHFQQRFRCSDAMARGTP